MNVGPYDLRESNDKPLHVYVKNDFTGLFFWLGYSGLIFSNVYENTKVTDIDFLNGDLE